MLDEFCECLSLFDPDPDAAIAAASTVVTDDDLVEIATADFGRGYEEYYGVLDRIRSAGRLDRTLQWAALDVCELAQWWGPDVFRPGAVAREPAETLAEHRQRFFATAIIACIAVDDGGRIPSHADFPAGLLSSALSLGAEMVRPVRRTLAAVALATADEDEAPIVAFGVLLAAASDPINPASPNAILRLGECILETEREVRTRGCAAHSEWLFGLTPHDSRRPLWRSLVRHLLVQPRRQHPEQTGSFLRAIGTRVLRAD